MAPSSRLFASLKRAAISSSFRTTRCRKGTCGSPPTCLSSGTTEQGIHHGSKSRSRCKTAHDEFTRSLRAARHHPRHPRLVAGARAIEPARGAARVLLLVFDVGVNRAVGVRGSNLHG